MAVCMIDWPFLSRIFAKLLSANRNCHYTQILARYLKPIKEGVLVAGLTNLNLTICVSKVMIMLNQYRTLIMVEGMMYITVGVDNYYRQ
jgi:hypothetical protein